jgi:hypothetical protein
LIAMTRRAVVLGLAVAFAGGGVAAHQTGIPAPQSRTVYLTITDRSGHPVDDLEIGELEIKEGGKRVAIEHLGVATTPLQIAFIVDDNGTGIFRSGLGLFIQRLEGLAVMSLSSVTGQTMKIVDYTSRVDTLFQGLATLNARPATNDGGQLLEGISEAALELRHREATRPVIIALTVGGEEHSMASSDHVLTQLRQSGATLHVISVAGSSLRSTMALTRPSMLLQENMHLSRVLGDGPKQSGGLHQSIVPTAGPLPPLQNLASEFLHQYRVTYTLPDGAKRSDRISVSVKRRGLQVRAPSRVPN